MTFGNVVAPVRDVTGALLHGLEADAANNRAFGEEIDAKCELPDALVAFKGV